MRRFWRTSAAFLAVGVACKSSSQSFDNSINIVSTLPADFMASVRSAISRVEILIDEPTGGYSLFASAGTPRAVTTEDGYAVTAEILDVDQDAKLEQRVSVIANPFAARNSWSVYLAGGALGDGFVLRGRLYRTDAGANELIAEATAMTDNAGATIQFGGGLKTVALAFNCATNISCRDGTPDTIIDRDAGPAALSNATSPALAFTCTNPPCTFQCTLDDGGAVACTSGFDAGPLADGVHTFTVRATDDAGRADPTPATMTWTVDGTRPQSAIVSVTSGPVAYGTTINLSGTASDNLSGLARVEVSVDGGGNWFDATGLASWSASFSAGLFSHRIYVRATDDAGNVEVPDGGGMLYTMGIPAADRLGIGSAGSLFTAGCRGAGSIGLYLPTSVIHDTVYQRLYIVDTENHRVVIHGLSSLTGDPIDQVADYTLGQPSPQHCMPAAAASATTMNQPWGAYLNGSKLYVSDRRNNRVLGIRLEILASGLAAEDVFGQPNFSSRDAGGGAAGLNGPTGIAYASSPPYMFVSDTDNNRVLIYDLWSSDAGEPAIAVLGQPDFDASASGVSASNLRSPMGLAFDGQNRRLFVADRSNNRVVVYQVPSTIDGGFAAKWVLGQPDFTSSNAATTATGLESPQSVSYDAVANRLYVADAVNHRVMVFDVAAIDAGEAAIAVIGQPGFDGGGKGVSSSRFDYPTGVYHVGGSLNRLYVADNNNNRVVAFNVASPQDASAATHLFGHPDGDGGAVWTSKCGNGPAEFGVTRGWGLAIDGTNNRLFASDVMVYGDDSITGRIAVFPLGASGLPAAYSVSNVLGQVDPWSCGQSANVTASTFLLPTSLAYDAQRSRLFAADIFTGRVSVFDMAQGAIANDMAATAVLGRAAFDAGFEFFCNPTASHFCWPYGVDYDSTEDRLFVTDSVANRVVVFQFDGGAPQTGMSASNVIGQDSFADKDAGVGANRMNSPSRGVYDSAAKRLYVADSSNNRVLVFDLGAGVGNGMSATRVIGQADFSTSADGGAPGQLASPSDVVVDVARRRLFVADMGNHRIQVWDTTNVMNGASPVNIIGQTSMSGTTANVTQTGLTRPIALALHPNGRWLWVTEIDTSRILAFDVGR